LLLFVVNGIGKSDFLQGDKFMSVKRQKRRINENRKEKLTLCVYVFAYLISRKRRKRKGKSE
jgi:hypothetical protein